MKKYTFLLSLFSGILTGISLSVEKAWPLVFFCLIPLYWSLVNAANSRDIYKQVLFYSLGYYFTNISWLFNIADVLPFETFKIPLIFLAILVLALLQSVYFFIPLMFLNRASKSTWGRIFIFSGLFIMGEWLSELLPFFHFPWCRLATATVNFSEFVASSSLLGSLFISFLICAINASLGEIIENWQEVKKCFKLLGTALAILIVNTFYGAFYFNYTENDLKSQPSVEMSLIKSSAGKSDKWTSDVDKNVEHYLNISQNSLTKNTKFVVWSETTLNVDLSQKTDIVKKISQFCKRNNVSLITGIIEKNSEGDKYNSVVIFTPDGMPQESYSKQVLVPFGEYLPFEDFLKEKFDWLKDYKSFSVKNKSIPLTSEYGKIGALICFESVFPSITRELTENGADVITLLSNDSWFDGTQAVYQHYNHAVLRAIESGKDLVRCSTGGVTAIISPDGKVIKSDGDYLRGEVRLRSKRTIYCYVGDILIFFPVGIIIYTIINEAARSKNERKFKQKENKMRRL